MTKPHIQAYRSAGKLVYVMYRERNDGRVLDTGHSVSQLAERANPSDQAVARVRRWLAGLVHS